LKVVNRKLHPTAPLHMEGPFLADGAIIVYLGVCIDATKLADEDQDVDVFEGDEDLLAKKIGVDKILIDDSHPDKVFVCDHAADDDFIAPLDDPEIPKGCEWVAPLAVSADTRMIYWIGGGVGMCKAFPLWRPSDDAEEEERQDKCYQILTDADFIFSDDDQVCFNYIDLSLSPSGLDTIKKIRTRLGVDRVGDVDVDIWAGDSPNVGDGVIIWKYSESDATDNFIIKAD